MQLSLEMCFWCPGLSILSRDSRLYTDLPFYTLYTKTKSVPLQYCIHYTKLNTKIRLKTTQNKTRTQSNSSLPHQRSFTTIILPLQDCKEKQTIRFLRQRLQIANFATNSAAFIVLFCHKNIHILIND